MRFSLQILKKVRGLAEAFQRKHPRLLIVSAVGGVIASFVGVGALLVLQAGMPLLCGETLFTPSYGDCSASYGSLLEVTHRSLLILGGVLLFFTVIFSSVLKTFFRFLTFYVPLALLVLIVAYYVPFCMGGWLGCTSLFPFAVLTSVTVFYAVLIALSCSLMVPRAGRTAVAILVCIGVLFVAWHYESLKDSFAVQIYDKDLDRKAQRTGEVADCENTRFDSQRDQCIRSFMIQSEDEAGCELINSLSVRQECVDYIIRNRAIRTLDTALCATIHDGGQRAVCKSNIEERLDRQ